MINRFSGILLLILWLTGGMAYSQTVTLSIPDSTVEAGATLLLPVSVSELTAGDQVLSGEWRFSVSSDIAEITGVTTDGTLLQGKNVLYNETNREFAFSSTEPVVGSGVILFLQVQMSATAVKFQESVIGITSAQLNEGTPGVSATSGTLRIKGIALTPKSPSPPLVEGQTFQFSVSGDVTGPVTWSSSNTAIATVTSEGLAEGITSGSVKIFVEDAEGQRDSTDLFRVEPATLLDLNVGVSNASVTQTLEGEVGVLVSDLTGLDITSGEITLSYTDTKLEMLSFTTAGTLLEGVADPVINEVNNTISFAFAGTTPLEGAGSLLNIQFRVLREATGTATFSALSARFNESFDAATSSGTVTILNAPIIEVQQEDQEITIGETTQFTVISGGTAPYTWRSSNTEIASIDENTGLATGLRRGTVEIVAVDSENFESAPSTLVVNDVTVFFPDTDVNSQDIFTVPLQTTDISGLGVNSFEADIQFDPGVLQFEGVDLTGTLSDGYALSLSEDSGIIRIAAAGTGNLTGEGALLNLQFSIQTGTSLGTVTELLPISLSFNEPGPDTPTATLRSGTVSYIDSSLPEQTVLSSPANGAADIELLPEYTWQAAAGSETYEIQISAVSDFSTLFETQSGLTSTLYQMVNPLNELTTYYWRVRAANASGNGPWSDSFSFTTIPGNPASPVLTAPADGAIDVPVNTIFEWQASQFSNEYLIEISEQSDFNVIAESATVSALTYQAQSLSFSTLYYWRVSGVNNSQGTGDPSAVFSFTTEDEQQAAIDPAASTVTATSPHVANGADASLITVSLVDTGGDPVSGLAANQFNIALTGSATAGPISETATPGIYTFEVTNSVAEQITVSVTADGVLLNDTPAIQFEEPVFVIDPAASAVTATSPHLADGSDASLVTITLIDTNGDAVSGVAGNQFDLALSGSSTAGAVTETATPGIYTFEVTDTVAEQVTVSVTADGVLLDDSPSILFEEPVFVIDSAASSVTVTSPHVADGVDASLVTVTLVNSNTDPVSGLTGNQFNIALTGSAIAGAVSETTTPGTYTFEVTNTVAGQVTVTVTADGVVLDDTPTILFEEPVLVIDPGASTVTATSPHVANGADPSLVTLTLVDTNSDPVSGLSGNQFTISLTGSAAAGQVSETSITGTYSFEVTNTVAEQITITVTVDGVALDDTPLVLFEEPVLVLDPSASTVTATSPHVADGTDASTVTMTLLYTNGDPVSGLEGNQFNIAITGSALPGPISETATAGIYTFEVTNIVAEQVTVTVTADGVLLNDTPAILFQEPLEIPEVPALTEFSPATGGAELRWEVVSEEFTSSYIIYRGNDIQNLQQIGTASAGTFTFIDNSLPSGIIFYAVSAENSDGGESELSIAKSFINTELIADTEWSLVSIPLATGSVDAELATVFSYNNQYVVTATLTPSDGYWVKTRSFDAESYPVVGVGLEETVLQLNEGWNLIGSLSDTVSLSDIQDPGNILSGAPVYGYNNNQYETTAQLAPGNGYWIHALQAGEIQLQLNLDPNQFGQGIKEESVAEMSGGVSVINGDRIEFHSRNNFSSLHIPEYSLRSGERLSYLLPPVAPDTPVDIRTEDDFSVIRFDTETRLKLSAAEFPVTIRYQGESEGSDAILRIRAFYGGDEITANIRKGERFQLTEKPEFLSVTRILEEEIVERSELLASYPNPFNPATTIHYRLQSTSYVKIEIFDVAGRKVGVLADGVMQTGEYRVRFDAQNLASGIYIVRFQNENQVDLRKITLIK